MSAGVRKFAWFHVLNAVCLKQGTPSPLSGGEHDGRSAALLPGSVRLAKGRNRQMRSFWSKLATVGTGAVLMLGLGTVPAHAAVYVSFAVAAPAVDPLAGALAGDAHLGGDVGDRAGLATRDEPAAALDRQRGITVVHGRVFLSAGRVGRTSHPAAERPVPSSQGLTRVTNVMTRNN
jgi:hypothetical protein